MKFSYGFNPNNEYGLDIAPSKEYYNTSLPKREDYPCKMPRGDFGFMELFVLLMMIPFLVFVYKFFYLLFLPLLPVSVIVFEFVREVAPLNKLLMFGGSFLAAYLFYRVLKFLFFSLSFGWRTFYLLGVYTLSVFVLYFFLGVYPDNEVLYNSLIEVEKVWISFGHTFLFFLGVN